MRFSKIIVITMLSSVFIFIAVMVAVFLSKGSVPDTLVQEFFGFFKIEGGALALITIGKEAFDAYKKKEGKYNADNQTETIEP